MLSGWDWETSNFTSIIIPEKELIMFMTIVNYTRTERVCKPLFAKALKLQSCWTKVLGHFWVIFQFTQVQPLPSPHKQCWTCVSRIFFEFQLCMGWGEGELQENFTKDALFYEGTKKWQKNMNTAVLSQGLLSMIVVLGLHGTYSPIVNLSAQYYSTVLLCYMYVFTNS